MVEPSGPRKVTNLSSLYFQPFFNVDLKSWKWFRTFVQILNNVILSAGLVVTSSHNGFWASRQFRIENLGVRVD